MKWNKSCYRKKSDIFIFKNACMFLLGLIVILMSLRTIDKEYIVGYIGICCVSLIYFLVRTKYIGNQIVRNKLALTKYSSKILKIHKLITILYIIVTTLIIIVCICQFLYDGNMKIWIWYASVLPMMYSDSVYLSGLTAFGDEKYLSGEYLINYSEIDDIKMIYEKNTIHGNMVLCSICRKNKEIGYDKLFTEEYHKLRLKVYQNKRDI